MKPGRLAAALAVFAALIAAGTGAAVARTAGPPTVKFPVPSVGGMTVFGFAVKVKAGARTVPKVALLGKAPSGVTVLGGIIRDSKRKNSFIGAVVVLNPKARKTSAVEATFVIVNVDNASGVGCGSTIYTIPTGPHPTGPCTFQPGFAFCGDAGARNLAMGYLGLPLPGQSPNELGNDALGVGCGRFGADSPESRDLLDFLSPPTGPPPPSQLTCTSPLSFFDPTEIVGKLQCNQAIGGFDFVAPGGFTLTNFLPGSCQLSSTLPHCPVAVPANSPFEFNLQTMPVPSAGMGGQIVVYQNGSVALRFNATGP